MNSKICYLCGKIGADSADHVPPKSIFLVRGTDMITVPAHTDCNNKWKLDDEYFRVAILNLAWQNSSDARTMFDKKLLPALGDPKKAKFRSSILKELVEMDVLSPDGRFLGKQHTIGIDANRVKGVIERTAKGIYYRVHGEAFPESWPIQSDLLVRETVLARRPVEAKGEFKEICGGIFKYRYEHDPKERRRGFFWFAFYDCVDFHVHSVEKHLLPPDKGNVSHVY